ncbi:Uncharacterized protein AC505_1687 [Pseudomonas syringae pv. maculicola]|nr:Uncharacterized protein AC505_1687 [Pseudomonas syringae pv. maculicola]
MARSFTALHPYGCACQRFDRGVINAQLPVIVLLSTATYDAGMSEPDTMRQARYVATGRDVGASTKNTHAPASMSARVRVQRADFCIADQNRCVLDSADAAPYSFNNTVFKCRGRTALHHECYCSVIGDCGVLNKEPSVTTRYSTLLNQRVCG